MFYIYTFKTAILYIGSDSVRSTLCYVGWLQNKGEVHGRRHIAIRPMHHKLLVLTVKNG